MGYDYSKSEYLSKYIDTMTARLSRMHPDWDVSQIEESVRKISYEKIQNPLVNLDNNYTGENSNASLLTVIDWVEDRKPIIAGNGTFYMNQDEARNPIAQMLDGFLTTRKKIKKEMFQVKDTKSYRYMDLDLKQSNEKINANSYYGGSGMPASAFYSKWSGGATTGTAQSVISTTYTTFESFLGDNYIFLDLDECMEWIEHALMDEDFEIDPFIKEKSVEEVYARLKKHFYKWDDKYEMPLLLYLTGYTKDELSRIYYKNNLREFISDHEKITDLYDSIFQSIKNYERVNPKDPDWKKKIPKEMRDDYDTPDAWNKFVNVELFYDPNKLPSTVEDKVKEFSSYLERYVYCRYLSFDRIHRLKNFFRAVVTIIDTDSNILSLDRWVEFTFDNILGSSTYGREKEGNVFIAVNTITYVITQVVQDILLYYGLHSNIPEKYRPRFNMKNEFYFSRLVLASVKKRYLSSIKLREGNMMNPEKSDVKGFDFKKSQTSDEVSEIFSKMVDDYILHSDIINVKELENAFFNFQNHIIDTIRSGDIGYLPIASAKEIGAYKDPSSEQSVRAVIAWNLLNPDEQIELPSKIRLLKLNIFKESDIDDLRNTHPDIYNIIINEIFRDKTGMFIKQKKDGKMNVKGLQALAIPITSKIPEWTQPYIDITTTVNGIMSPFKSVMEIFNGQYAEEGKTVNSVSRKSEGLTNIIRF